jgi:hypothetical protein
MKCLDIIPLIWRRKSNAIFRNIHILVSIAVWYIIILLFERLRTMLETSMIETSAFNSSTSIWEQILHFNTLPLNSILSKTGNMQKNILAIKFRRSDDSKNSGDLRNSNWQHCDDSDNKSDNSWPKWRQLSCQNVVSYDHVTTTRVISDNHVTTTGVLSYDHVTTTWVVSYDHVTTTGVVSYDLVMTTRVVSYDLATTLTDNSKLLSSSFHWLKEVANWHCHRLPPPTQRVLV